MQVGWNVYVMLNVVLCDVSGPLFGVAVLLYDDALMG
jgi:hypothetical protein